MNLNEEYGFDAFCQGLIAQWPEVSLTLKRSEDKVFATAAALGTLAVAVSRPEELVGSCVRRAVVDLHTKLVVADQAVTAAVATIGEDAARTLMTAFATAAKAAGEKVDSLVVDLENILVTIQNNPSCLTAEDFETLDLARHNAEIIKDCEESVDRLRPGIIDLQRAISEELFETLHDDIEVDLDICIYDHL